ncbi:MAG TPA: hypothetical protein DCY88_26010 [Cyanobacteria bacterium UBA11372]|nr:hypothetical protein [Cyanobacteria bacterium UBA11372]
MIDRTLWQGRIWVETRFLGADSDRGQRNRVSPEKSWVWQGFFWVETRFLGADSDRAAIHLDKTCQSDVSRLRRKPYTSRLCLDIKKLNVLSGC